MTAVRWSARLPPILLGAGLGIVGMVAAGLLLYGGPGFLPALVVVLAAQLGALAAGLFYGNIGKEGATREAVRGGWYLVLVALALAALFSGAWEVWGGFGVTGVSQGVGLALLVVFPLFSGGAVIARLTRMAGARGTWDPPGTWALLGGAMGVAALGLFLFPLFRSTTSILLLALVAVSLAALIQDRSLLMGAWIEEEADSQEGGRPGKGMDGGVERWRGASVAGQRWVLTGEDRIHLVTTPRGEAVLGLDRAMTTFLGQRVSRGGRVLFLGAGRVPLLSALLDPTPEDDGWEVQVMTRWAPQLRRLCGELQEPGFQRVTCLDLEVCHVLMGSPAHLPPGSWDLIVLDTLSMAWAPRSFRLPIGALTRLREGLTDGGLLLMGPLQDGGSSGSLLTELQHLSRHFPRLSLYLTGRTVSDAPPSVPEGRIEQWQRLLVESGARTAFLAASQDVGRPFPDQVEGYLRVRMSGNAASPSPANLPRSET